MDLNINDELKYASLQMAAEAFLVSGGNPLGGDQLAAALILGNLHNSRFTASEAKDFAEHWTPHCLTATEKLWPFL